jgi:dTDP-4-amino-4,6-dideoxygalactose transaminase
MNIPFADLKKQYTAIKKEMDSGIIEVIESTQFILGKFVEEFERSFAKYCNSKYCIGVSSGTSAIELALKASGIGPGDEVITIPHTFIATAEAITNVGATVKFVDVNPETGTMDASKLKVTKKTKAIIVVHIYGQPVDMDPIIDFAKQHNLIVIEDCAQAHGAEYKGKRVPVYGIGCFSFYPGKNLGAYGDAGAVVCNDSTLAEKIRMLRDHGRPKGSKYSHDVVGNNYRIDGIQGKILSIKLKSLDAWTELRRKHAAKYKSLLKVSLISEMKYSKSVYHLFVIKHDNRDKLKEFLEKNGISCGIHYPIPLHLQPAYKFLGYKEGDFPVSEKLAKTILSLPMYPEMTDEEIVYVCEKIKEYK